MKFYRVKQLIDCLAKVFSVAGFFQGIVFVQLLDFRLADGGLDVFYLYLAILFAFHHLFVEEILVLEDLERINLDQEKVKALLDRDLVQGDNVSKVHLPTFIISYWVSWLSLILLVDLIIEENFMGVVVGLIHQKDFREILVETWIFEGSIVVAKGKTRVLKFKEPQI